MACPVQVGGENLPQVEEFKYLGVLITSGRRRDSEISRRHKAAVMESLYWTVVVKRELSHKTKLSIFRAVYIPTLTYMSTDLKNIRFSNFVVFPLDGTEDDALFDSGTDTLCEVSELAETY